LGAVGDDRISPNDTMIKILSRENPHFKIFDDHRGKTAKSVYNPMGIPEERG